ncbi:hypothetical protein HID58_003996 [Brassica napus]|uniref:Uncharacterized protein n=1 Tax=Brassica napus TaxID=3708 RepID=A0ABQ7XK99_BRANA|nr:hypothetical protein HID58_003996 [Brassica napus]
MQNFTAELSERRYLHNEFYFCLLGEFTWELLLYHWRIDYESPSSRALRWTGIPCRSGFSRGCLKVVLVFF